MTQATKGADKTGVKIGRTIKIYESTAAKLRQLKGKLDKNIVEILDDIVDREYKRYFK